MEDESAIERPEQLTRECNGALQAITKDLERGAKIVRDDGGAAGSSRVVARVREASGGFEQDLELEQELVLAIDGERREPGLARGTLLALEAPCTAQKVGVGVARAARRRL